MVTTDIDRSLRMLTRKGNLAIQHSNVLSGMNYFLSYSRKLHSIQEQVMHMFVMTTLSAAYFQSFWFFLLTTRNNKSLEMLLIITLMSRVSHFSQVYDVTHPWLPWQMSLSCVLGSAQRTPWSCQVISSLISGTSRDCTQSICYRLIYREWDS